MSPLSPGLPHPGLKFTINLLMFAGAYLRFLIRTIHSLEQKQLGTKLPAFSIMTTSSYDVEDVYIPVTVDVAVRII